MTHLPQIAAYADAHFAIHKVQRDGRTLTEVHRLDEAGRVEELAAMIGGPAGGPAAEASARELLERAARFRQARGVARRGVIPPAASGRPAAASARRRRGGPIPA